MKHTLTIEGTDITFEASERDAEALMRIINDLLSDNGVVSIDAQDVKEILDVAERITVGEGTASGEGRCAAAARKAVENVMSANRLLVEVKSGPEITLMELADAAEMVHETVDPVAPIIWGHVIDESIGDSVNVSVAAVSFAVED